MNRLKEIRESNNLSQQELADKAKVTTQTIHRIENNKVKPHKVVIQSIANALNIDPKELGLR